jgi:hypothetical protein
MRDSLLSENGTLRKETYLGVKIPMESQKHLGVTILSPVVFAKS